VAGQQFDVVLNLVRGVRPLTDLAAVHDQAAAGRLPGKTILIP
jgi:hypothetical protein